MADDALLRRIDAFLAREASLHDIMHMDHAELRAWQREGVEGMREMNEWIRQMAEATRDSRREFVRESAERRREFEEHRREWREEYRAHREALWKIIDRLDEGGAGAGA